MKVLHITTIPNTLKFLAGQVGYVKSRGLEVRALSSPGDYLHEFGDSEGIAVDEVLMERRISPIRDLVALFRLWSKLRKIRPQIVHAHTPKGGLLGMMAGWLAGVPVRIYHIHGLPMVTSKGWRHAVLWLAEKISCTLSHQILCVSPSIREVAITSRLCRAKKAKVLARGTINGLDATQRFNPTRVQKESPDRVRREHGIPDDAMVIGFVGRLVCDKGIVELIQAWKQLKVQFPCLHLLMAGRFELRDAVPNDVEKIIAEDERIHHTSWVEDTPPFYAAMDVLAFPTYREGFGLCSIEASAMEVPVVTTRIPGCVDAVQDGVTGTLVPVNDAEALASAVERYLNDPELRRQHGQAGRARVLRDFQPEVIWEAIYQEYVRLLEEKGLPVPEVATATVEKAA